MFVPSLSWQIVVLHTETSQNKGWFLRREEEDVLWAERQLEEAEASGGKKTVFLRHVFTQNDHFAKTGSGQT